MFTTTFLTSTLKNNIKIFFPVLASKFKLNDSVNEEYKFDPL